MSDQSTSNRSPSAQRQSAVLVEFFDDVTSTEHVKFTAINSDHVVTAQLLLGLCVCLSVCNSAAPVRVVCLSASDVHAYELVLVRG